MLGSRDEKFKDWISIKVLEGDEEVIKHIQENNGLKERLIAIKDKAVDYELEIVNKRYEFVNKVIEKSIKKPDETLVTITDKIDKIVTNKYLGIPIFAIIMYVIFQLTFVIGEDLLGGIVEGWIESLGIMMSSFLYAINSPDLVTSFVIEGIVGGVGAVIVFIPPYNDLVLLGILEDTGYMARAALCYGRSYRGLRASMVKTFISMIVGFGCNVPGVMATRTLENKRIE